jgi:hypothetical protein
MPHPVSLLSPSLFITKPGLLDYAVLIKILQTLALAKCLFIRISHLNEFG